MSKVFLLGLGAQKAGTTWVHRYLRSHPNCDFGALKEYHIFDVLNLPECYGFLKSDRTKAVSVIEREVSDWQENPILKRIAFLSDPELYFSYFSTLLSDDKTCVSGDITPTYCGLSVEVLTHIKSSFEKRGISTRPVFLMRNPVYRLRSMVRMDFREKNILPTQEQELRLMKQKHLGAQDLLRVNYHVTIERLGRVFGDQVFLGFYETLFQTDTVKQLAGFLDIEYVEPDFDTRVNESRNNNKMDEETYRYFKNGYEEVFSYCIHNFGEDLINELWAYKN